MTNKVSVIVPLFNKENFIEKTLFSLKNQTYKDFECLIVDDGSTDDSVKVVKNFIEKYDLDWQLISQKNSGQTKARNAGIHNSHGLYIAFLDADDLWTPNKLELQVNTLDKFPECSLVLTSYAIFKSLDSTPRVVKHANPKRMNLRWLDMRGFGGGLESIGMSPRKYLDAVDWFDESLSTSSGLDLSLKLGVVGDIQILSEISMYYRISTGQWHSDFEPLKRDLQTLKIRHAGDSLRKIERRHQSYFYWVHLRPCSRIGTVKIVLANTITFRFSRLSMLTSLLSRNLWAQICGFFHKKQTFKFLNDFK
jgi:glycosyltransferase involved in cell wall biosynthesis